MAKKQLSLFLSARLRSDFNQNNVFSKYVVGIPKKHHSILF